MQTHSRLRTHGPRPVSCTGNGTLGMNGMNGSQGYPINDSILRYVSHACSMFAAAVLYHLVMQVPDKKSVGRRETCGDGRDFDVMSILLRVIHVFTRSGVFTFSHTNHGL